MAVVQDNKSRISENNHGRRDEQLLHGKDK